MPPGRNEPCPCGSGKKYKRCCYLSKNNKTLNIPLPDIKENIDDLDDYDGYFNKDYIDDYEDEDDFNDIFFNQGNIKNAINNLRRILLDKKPHIKEYNKMRKMHEEISDTMVQYYQDGKFKKIIDTNFIPDPAAETQSSSGNQANNPVHLLETNFNMETGEGYHGFYNILIYKSSPNINCITEDFIKNCHYKKPEKIEFPQSMLDSKAGLFEVTAIDTDEGYAYLKNVFTNEEHKICDIGLSGEQGYGEFYLYTRIIKYHDISFGTGLNLVFKKTDNFIINHIQEHKKNFLPYGEHYRFLLLYNYYSNDPDRIRTTNSN